MEFAPPSPGCVCGYGVNPMMPANAVEPSARELRRATRHIKAGIAQQQRYSVPNVGFALAFSWNRNGFEHNRIPVLQRTDRLGI
jgi:hypothetical protein